jgi:hypothetical protein
MSSLLIESEESKTNADGPVFNRIRMFSTSQQDVWMMQQSHHGLGAESKNWDRLAILVDKTRSPKIARFVQLEAGPLAWNGNLKAKNLRVSCFMCHSNGPRAIRPNFESSQVKSSLLDRLRVLVWNLRIKTYGRILNSSEHDTEDLSAKVPFRFRGELENEKLAVKTCLRCHREEGLFVRGPLTRQNAMTIQFMVSRGHMPPPGFALSGKERKEVDAFVSGL